MIKEIIKPIKGCEGYYVSDMGKIIGKQKRQLVGTYRNGYHYVTLTVNGKSKSYPAHRLVLETFLDRKLKKGYEVHHRNGHKDDNRLINLAEVTHRENMADSDTKSKLSKPRRRYSFVYEEIK